MVRRVVGLFRWVRSVFRLARLLILLGLIVALGGIALCFGAVWFASDPLTGLKTLQEWSIDQQFGAPNGVMHPTGTVQVWRADGSSERTYVFVHGFGDAAAGWTNTAAHIAQKHSVVLLDLPGHGRSELGDAALTIDRLRGGLNAVLETVEGPVTLVGNSMGGWVSAEWTLRNPTRVDHLVLVNTAGFVAPLDRDTLLPLTRDGVVMKNKIVMGDHAPPLPGIVLDGLIEMNRAPHLHALFEHLTQEALHLEGRFDGSTVPTTLVWGTPIRTFQKLHIYPRYNKS